MATENAITDTSLPTRKPTEYLLGDDQGELSAMAVYRLTINGFNLKDLQDLLSPLPTPWVEKGHRPDNRNVA